MLFMAAPPVVVAVFIAPPMTVPVRQIAVIPIFPLTPRPRPSTLGHMSTTQTPAVPTLSPAAHALLADFADPDLSELDLARRHGLVLDSVLAASC